MAKITRIKASDGPREASSRNEEPPAKKVTVKDKKADATKAKELRKRERQERRLEREKAAAGKKVFILFRPFVALGRYLRDSWREIRQVRWPTRKATWKMTLAVLIYTAIFVLFISLLDLFFKWLFSLIIK